MKSNSCEQKKEIPVTGPYEPQNSSSKLRTLYLSDGKAGNLSNVF